MLVTSVTSSCGNVHLVSDDLEADLKDVLAEPLERPATCHIETRLSDGEHFAFDIPFTQPIECPGCIGGYSAIWQALFIDVPPPSFDGSFAPTDVSDAGPTDE